MCYVHPAFCPPRGSSKLERFLSWGTCKPRYHFILCMMCFQCRKNPSKTPACNLIFGLIYLSLPMCCRALVVEVMMSPNSEPPSPRCCHPSRRWPPPQTCSTASCRSSKSPESSISRNTTLSHARRPMRTPARPRPRLTWGT